MVIPSTRKAFEMVIREITHNKHALPVQCFFAGCAYLNYSRALRFIAPLESDVRRVVTGHSLVRQVVYEVYRVYKYDTGYGYQ